MAENAIRPPKQIGLNELNKEGWESWLESFEWYEIATQLSSKAPEVQVAIFMAAMGREAQNIFKSFNLNNADKNNLSIVKDKFNNYFSPKLNTTIERFKFNQMKQKEDESFNDFLTRIKLQIANCKYAVMSDELLKDRIVVGIINNEIRERLLSEADLNLGKATQICIACENATNQMKHVLSDSDKQVAVTKMNSKKWEDRKEPRKENTTNQSHKIIENCRNCGRSHKINQCPAYQKRCNKCKKLNHFANLCRSKNTNSYKVKQIVGSPEPEMNQEFVIQSVENTNLTEDWYEEVKIKGKKVNMKLDTGAQCNVLPLSLAGRLNLEIQRSPVKSLISFSGHRIPVEGQSLAMCMVKNMTAYIRFIISRDNTCPILGRQTCSNLGLVKRVNTCQVITQEYQELFEGIGCLKGYEYEAKFQTSDMNMQVRPPRPIPLSIKESVKKELEEMEDNGIIKKVNYPTPISSQMVIAKQKGKIRICIDPSDINKVILRSHFPLRTFDQIAVNLHGSKYFTKLDLKKGYWQIKVAPNSQRYFTFSTPWGRYMFLRVPFGIKTAPEIFQKIMADLLQDLEGTENSMDDILIHAPDPQTLEIRTRAVLQRLKENGIKLNRDKCKFQLQEVQFLGHIVTTEGIKIDPEKVRAIGEIKSPSNKQELQRLLGMVQYLSRFIPNLAEKTKNMRLLLKKDTPWLWDESLDCDLLDIKTLLRTAPTLKFFNPNGNLTLSVDASSYALGAVLLQNGKPIAYASSALNSTQQNYAQIEKEALAIKFGCDKFHQLIYGKTVDVETDHRPLETIFKKPLSKAPPRLQRIFLQIQQYDLRIKYKKGKELLTADLLSRDCSYEDTYLEENFEVLMTTPTNKSSYEELQALTKEDQELQELKNLILYGWPNYKSAVPESCKKYWPYRDELSTNEDLIFKGSRVFIPLRWKAKILKLIHEGHQGTNSCLRRARDSIYWHGMSQDIINTVENCRTCQANQRNKTKEPMIIKEIPSLPWEIVAADIFSIKGKNYLLITDNYSGFIDFKEMKTMNSAETIEYLKKWFSVHGIPRLLETDNGPNFTSRDFKDFQKKWLFDHQTSSPLYPKSNGLAERAVQTAKNLIRKCLDSGQEVELALLNFYNTPRDGLPSPAQCLFSRRTRTLLPTSTHQLEPEIQKGHTQNLRNKRERQKTHHDKTAKTTRSFKEGEKIMLKQHHREWIPARVTQEVAPRSYKVQTPTGEYRRNSSFMRHTNLESPKQQRRRIPEIPKSTLITRTRSTRTAPCPLQQGPGGSSSHPNDLKNEFLQRGRSPEPFNFSNPGDWPKWIRRFERFRQASGLINNPENEQVNMLVYCMGDNADDILLSCKIASDQLENYGKVIECFESHFIPRRNIIYERARFNQRCQQEGEKVNEFITALHSLAEHCNFGMLHDELIRDRIVVGVRDRALSERMQLDTDLTLVKATLMAKQLESVKEQQSSLYQQDSIDQIKKMPNHIKETKRHEQKIRQFKSNQLGGSSHGCTRCGNSNNHDWKNCPAMNSYCSKCKKKGPLCQSPNGIPLETVGMIHVKLQNKGQHLNSKIYIVDKLKQPLLSGETSEKLNIVRMIQQFSPGGRGGQRGRLGSGDNRGCYNCGEEGHRKFECTKPAHGGGRGRGQSRDGGSNNTGYNCGEVGHRKYECTKNTAEGGGQEENQRKSKKACYTCGEFGHKKDDCPKSGTQESGDEEESSDNEEEETPQKRKQAEDSEEDKVEAEEPPKKKSKKPKSKKKEEDCYLTLQAHRTMPLESARSREMRRPPLRHQPGSQGDARMTRSKRPRRIALHQRPHLQEMEGCRGTTKTRIQRRASLQCQPCIQDGRAEVDLRVSAVVISEGDEVSLTAERVSWKPMSKPHKDELEEELSAYIQSIEFPATEERLLEISRKQKEDSLCSQLAKYCMSGWPKNKREVDPALRGYWQFQEDLTYQNGLLLRGQRILIPKSLRKDILEKLHQGHFGINKCISRAKESVWWLGISQEIERMVSSCTKCLKERKPKHEPLMPSEFPIRPWQKVGMDLFYLNGRWYLIVCDYYSRYPEISLLQNLTAQEVISRLKSIFARHGTPETDLFPAIESSLMPRYLDSEALQEREKRRVINQKRLYDKRHDVHSLPPLQQGDSVWIRDQRVEGTVLHKSEEPRSNWVQTPQGKVRRNRLHLTPLPKMGSTMDASEDGQRQEQRNEETPTSTSTWLSRRCKDDQEQETEEDCPTPTASSTRDGRMQRDNQDQEPEKSLPSMPAVHTRYGRAVKIPR
ncbi:K02A2.6-like, partial [Cordylochernes scorpioides]